MRARPLSAVSAVVLACGVGGLAVSRSDEPDTSKLAMTPAVVCSRITGYGDYVALDEPALTRDDKMLIYYEPSGYEYEVVGKEYRVHLVQDARIRRRGEKTVLQAKDKLLEYKGRSKVPPLNIFLTNTIALKPLPVGEYDLEIILRDEIGKGLAARQVCKFRVKAANATEDKKPDNTPKG
jgi:hypothetical protein